VARGPQPPMQHFFEQQPAPAPSGLLVGLAAAGLFIASVLGTIVKEIAKRWRGVVIAHLFFLTLWMAIQVFFFATGAYWCLPSNSSAADWFSRYFSNIARCGAAPQTLPAFQGSTAAAAPAPAPAPPRPPATVPVPASPRVPAAPSQGAPPPAAGTPLPPAPGAAPWSGRMVQNCWRNRSVENGDCYDNLYARRSVDQPPAPPPPPPPVVRYRRYPAPPYSCRRPYDCWPDEYWFYDYGAP
jgi:hypothetical protein